MHSIRRWADRYAFWRRSRREGTGDSRAAGGSRYQTFWDAMARNDAFTAIFSHPDGSSTARTEFDNAGRNDATRLRQYVTPESVVLDAGCGIGRIEKHLAPHCKHIHAVDVSDEMLARARAWTADLRNISFYCRSIVDLSVFPSGMFDFAFSLLVLQHLSHEDAFLALTELARVLKPTGRALVQFPNLESSVYGASFVNQARAHSEDAGRMRIYTPDSARRLVALAGLEVLEREVRAGGSVDANEIDLVLRVATSLSG